MNEPGTDPQLRDPTSPLWRAAVLLRVLTLVFAAVVVLHYRTGYARPGLALALVGVMAVGTAVTSVYYLAVSRRQLWVTVADLGLCCLVMAASRLALTTEQLTVTGVPLVPTIWVAGVVAIGAVRGGPVLGTGFGAVVGAVNIAVRGYLDTDLSRDLVLLVGVGFTVGWAARTARVSTARLAMALRAEAATAERERLARSIHDGVLQVLARVRTRGAEVGGEAGELARLAGEQEVALRALVSSGPVRTDERGADLVPPLLMLSTARVQVSAPGTPVILPDHITDELLAAVREALTNVERHAGPDARAWVLVEDLPDEVVLSVRDDGVGIAEGRLAVAEAAGRLGVAASIRGRLAQLGGTATCESAPNSGTEWELRVPRATGADR